MSNLTLKLLDLIKEGNSLNEISDKLGISNKKIYNILREVKLLGMNFERKYYSDGSIFYLPKNKLEIPTKKDSVNLITGTSSDSIKVMLISDLQIGNKQESKDAWYKIYDYCIVQGINVIIIAGDFFDGINIGKPNLKMHSDPFEQIDYAMQNYPFDKSIINFTLFGNHDIDFLTSYGIDLITYLENFRHDIVPIGYGCGRVNIKNDKIFVTHPLCIGVNNNPDLSGNYLLVRGHHHTSKSIITGDGSASLTVPSLSKLFPSADVFLPGAMVLNIKFKDGYFDTVYVENLLVNDRVNVVSTMQYSIMPSTDRKFDGHIKYEEDFSKRKTLNRDKKTKNFN